MGGPVQRLGVEDAMKPIDKWWPHLSPRVKRISAVTFDDGTTIETTVEELRAYLRTVDDEAANELARGIGLRDASEVSALSAAWRSVKAGHAGSAEKKRVSREAILAFLADFEKAKGTKYGGKTAACIHFRITMKTLNVKIDEGK